MPDPVQPALREQGFRLLEDELKVLMDAFAMALRNIGEPDLADYLPWVGQQPETPATLSRSLGQGLLHRVSASKYRRGASSGSSTSFARKTTWSSGGKGSLGRQSCSDAAAWVE
jgi:hypothetical protein